jgi:hypothetical protein
VVAGGSGAPRPAATSIPGRLRPQSSPQCGTGTPTTTNCLHTGSTVHRRANA